MSIQHRFSTATPDRVFTKRKNNTCLTVLSIPGAIPGAPLALQAALTNIAAIAALTCTVAIMVSQATVETAVQKLLLTLSASLRDQRNICWFDTGGNIINQHSGLLTFCFRGFGMLKPIHFFEMANHTAYSSAEKKGISKRYQTSVEEFFLIPWRYQFPIQEFFLIPGRYQFQIEDFF
jgi:hypothetical protein